MRDSSNNEPFLSAIMPPLLSRCMNAPGELAARRVHDSARKSSLEQGASSGGKTRLVLRGQLPSLVTRVRASRSGRRVAEAMCCDGAVSMNVAPAVAEL